MEGEMMRDRLIPPLITLIAGAVVCIIDIYHKTELLLSLKRLLIVLIVFYIIGLVARSVIRKVLSQKPKANEEELEGDSEEELEDDSDEVDQAINDIDTNSI